MFKMMVLEMVNLARDVGVVALGLPVPVVRRLIPGGRPDVGDAETTSRQSHCHPDEWIRDLDRGLAPGANDSLAS